jgi:tetratricopeptide (TPR) repeat protein
MSFISKILAVLFSKPPRKKEAARRVRTGPSVPKARNTTLDGDILQIAEPSFMGIAHVSPNKRWVVACADFNGNGRVALVDYEGDRVMTILNTLAQPLDAAVSDVGTFVVIDSGFNAQLRADLRAFSTDGQELYRRQFTANAYAIAISVCGQFAVVQTANAPKDADGSLLEVCDILNQKILFSVRLSTNWSQKYSFDVVEGKLKKLWVKFDKLGRFAYDPSGKFLDERKYLDARLTKGGFVERILAAEELLSSSPSPAVAEKVLLAVDEALVQGATEQADWAAKIHRLRGEAFELLQQSANAIGAYETALSLNPKIGVKSKLAALRKLQATS